MLDLDQGPCAIKRLRGCGCGNEYVAIDPDGDIYPCHQFVGMDNWLMGNLHENTFDTEMKKKLRVRIFILSMNAEAAGLNFIAAADAMQITIHIRTRVLRRK